MGEPSTQQPPPQLFQAEHKAAETMPSQPLQQPHPNQPSMHPSSSSSSQTSAAEVMGPPLPPKHASHSPRLQPSAHERSASASHQLYNGAAYVPTPDWSIQYSAPPPPSRHSLPASYSLSVHPSHSPPHSSAGLLSAPRPTQHYGPLSSPPHDHRRMHMRGDGFLLDADDEPDGLDLSNGESSEPLPLQLQRGPSNGHPGDVEHAGGSDGTQTITDGESNFMSGVEVTRPRSAGALSTYGVPLLSSVSRAVSESAPLQLVCPSCGEQPVLAEGGGEEHSFHAHVTRCFVTHRAAVITGRPPRTPQAKPMSAANIMHDGSIGPIRKTRVRASSAAASTGSAAQLASALAMHDSEHGGSSHGYHPYHSSSQPANLAGTLRQLRRTVDQLDVHARISIMEAFHKLSRVASVELQQQAAAQQQAQQMQLGVAASPRAKKLRSLTNSPSPRTRPQTEDRVCKDILSLLYSPRITAPHPSPNPHGHGLHIGVPSPLVLGVHGHTSSRSAEDEAAASASAGSSLHPPSSILGSPVVSHMDTLELDGPLRSPLESPTVPLYPHALHPVSSGVESALSSPAVTNTQMEVGDGSSESDAAAGSALALTGAFVRGISSGASSPASSHACSEQTSPSAPTDVSATSTAGGSLAPPHFPAHCHAPFPDPSVPPMHTPSHANPAVHPAPVYPSPSVPLTAPAPGHGSSSSSSSSTSVSPESPDPLSTRMAGCTAEVADKQRMMRRNEREAAVARG